MTYQQNETSGVLGAKLTSFVFQQVMPIKYWKFIWEESAETLTCVGPSCSAYRSTCCSVCSAALAFNSANNRSAATHNGPNLFSLGKTPFCAAKCEQKNNAVIRKLMRGDIYRASRDKKIKKRSPCGRPLTTEKRLTSWSPSLCKHSQEHKYECQATTVESFKAKDAPSNHLDVLPSL